MSRASSQENGYLVFIPALVLMAIGAAVVYSASAFISADSTMYLRKHLIWIFVGLVCIGIFSRIDYHFFNDKMLYIAIGTLVLLGLVLIFGKSVLGAKRWFRLAGLSFQPSELAKFVMILYFASYFDRHKSTITDLTKMWPLLSVWVGTMGLILLEPDLGTPMLICFTGVILLYVAGLPKKVLMIVGSVAVIAGLAALISKPYRVMRVLSFIGILFGNTQGVDLKTGYQLDQALCAVGSGGLLGRGLGKSVLRYAFLPERHTDFIFPIFAEEMGLLGSLMILLLFISIAYGGWKIAIEAKDAFGQLVAVGVTVSIVFQALFNLAVVTGCAPTKGLPLPFISFGGTSLAITCCMVGILLNISGWESKKKKGLALSARGRRW
ncbi:MAG: FtsW/RodA/SpoVE family cell cycle protein [Elusimicrobiota bacterium]